VLGGFAGATVDGRITTLGRGGSDYSGAIVGAGLDAAEIQIWADVDGMLTADPRVIPQSRLVPRLSFAEVSVEPEMALLCVVGDRLRVGPAIAARVIRLLEEVPLRMISQAASRRNITVILHRRTCRTPCRACTRSSSHDPSALRPVRQAQGRR